MNPIPFPFFPKVPSTLATTIVPSPLVSRGEILYYIEGSSVIRPVREVVLIFKNLYLYTALFL